MNSVYLIGLSILSVIVVISLISWLLIISRGLWYIKLIAITACFLLVFTNIYTWRELQGTPRKIELTDNIIVRSYFVIEPSENSKGKIYLWVIGKNNEPLNVEIPYSKEMHKELTENRGLRNGRAQKMTKIRKGDNESREGYRLIDIQEWMVKDKKE